VFNMNEINYSVFAKKLSETAIEAGQVIMEIREKKFDVLFKDDNSPVTLADQAAEDIILRDLKKLTPSIPIIAEENTNKKGLVDVGDVFWLVDPLDGTKEFITDSDEFTVNIALIEYGVPTFGIVYAPALSVLYMTKTPTSAVIRELDKNMIANEKSIMVRKVPYEGITAITSKSHGDETTEDFLQKYNITQRLSKGSSLKFCLLAAGEADFYPRFGPTMEWDTAAGHAILNAAGGHISHLDGTPFHYHKKDFRNGPFIANAHVELI
jgi:3'(2'), 5'-bisphosphate nucleotidase